MKEKIFEMEKNKTISAGLEKEALERRKNTTNFDEGEKQL